jgi:molybdenum cofactor guanylyltransferase
MGSEIQPSLRFAGVLLAGGASARMGSNKALLTVEGQPLWRSGYELLRRAGAMERWVSVAAASNWLPPDVPALRDSARGLGPMSGIDAALEKIALGGGQRADAAPLPTHLLVLAVDLPRMQEAWFTRLMGECAPARGAVGQWSDTGAFEPLAGVYPVEIAPLVRQAVACQSYSMQRLVKNAVAAGLLAVRPITAPEAGWFANWNRPEDLAEGLKG